MATKNAVAAEEETKAVATVELMPGMMQISDDMIDEMRELAGAGVSENIEDRGTPLLYIAQSSSKFVKKQKAEYIPGLEPGMVFNNVTGRMWSAETEPLLLYPCFFRAHWLEWTPQSEGGGFHGSHPRDTPLLRESTEKDGRGDIRMLRNGHELVLTHEYYCLFADTLQPIVVPMSSSNLGASSKIQTLLSERKGAFPNGNVVTLPGYYSTLSLSTVFATNDSGDWFKYAPKLAEPNTSRMALQMCRDFALAVKNSEVKVAAPEQSLMNSSQSGGAADSGRASGLIDDTIPF